MLRVCSKLTRLVLTGLGRATGSSIYSLVAEVSGVTGCCVDDLEGENSQMTTIEKTTKPRRVKGGRAGLFDLRAGID